MNLRFLLVIVLFSNYSLTSAQTCGTDIIHQRRIATDTSYARAFTESQVAASRAVKLQKASSFLGAYYGMQAAVFTIPVVVHVLHHGNAEGHKTNPLTANITGAIDYLNQVYGGTLPGIEGAGDIGIRFALATRDPENNPTTGIHRVNANDVLTGANLTNYVTNGVFAQTVGLNEEVVRSSVRWDPGLYYNLYLVNKIDGTDGTSGGPFIAGFAYFPTIYNVKADGAIMLARVVGPGEKTLPHEIGHALGLAHPFQGWAPGPPVTCATGDCNTTGDQICDTDPVTQPAFVARTGINSCTGTPYSINTEHNFMNYTDVFTLFTNEQRARMLAHMSFPMRASLASSWATSVAYPYAFTPAVNTCPSATSPSGLGGTFGGLLELQVDDRTFSSGVTDLDGGYIDKSNSPLHLIPLNPGVTSSFRATVLTSGVPQQLAVYIDYNNNGGYSPDELIGYLPHIAGTGLVASIIGSFTVPTSAVSNAVLRMRVINEVSTSYGYNITGGCYPPVYGQTEDFPVFIAGVLPVEYKYLRGAKTGDDITLSWGTSLESGNKRFEVERSADAVNFTKIGTVSNQPYSAYSFLDNHVVLPVYFYRIKCIDQHDKITYSSVVMVRSELEANAQSIRVTNPFTSKVDLTLMRTFDSPATIELLDLNGKILVMKRLPAGQQLMQIDVGGNKLPAGIYFLKIKCGDFFLTKKLVKQ